MPTIQVIVIPVDDEQPIEVRYIERGDLKAMQEIVGGYVEVNDLTNPDASIWSNEEGKIVGLLPNRRATCVLWVGNSAFRGKDYLSGHCFITGAPDDNSNTTSAPDRLVDLLTKPGHFKVQIQTLTDNTWSGNGRVFDDWITAYVWGIELSERWMMVKEIQIVTI